MSKVKSLSDLSVDFPGIAPPCQAVHPYGRDPKLIFIQVFFYGRLRYYYPRVPAPQALPAFPSLHRPFPYSNFFCGPPPTSPYRLFDDGGYLPGTKLSTPGPIPSDSPKASRGVKRHPFIFSSSQWRIAAHPDLCCSTLKARPRRLT